MFYGLLGMTAGDSFSPIFLLNGVSLLHRKDPTFSLLSGIEHFIVSNLC